MSDAQQDQDTRPVMGFRVKFGIILFGFSILLPVLGIPLLTITGLSTNEVTASSVAMLMGAEFLGIAAVAVMGKSGYAYIKSRLLGFLKQHGPADEVSRTRYTIGLIMFSVPILFGWMTPYISGLLPWYSGNEIVCGIIGDLFLLSSLFVLGGDFWDKLQALFIHSAKAVIPKAVR
jgi:hypothetical protein